MPIQDREWYRTYDRWARRARLKGPNVRQTGPLLQDRESHRTYRRWTRRNWRFHRLIYRTVARAIAKSVKAAVAAVLLAYIAAAFIHLTNGFALGTSLGAGFQDARLGLTCPKNIGLQWQFIDRTQLEHLGLVSSLNQGKHVYREICSDDQFPPKDWIIPSPAPVSDSTLNPTGAKIAAPTTEFQNVSPTALASQKTQASKPQTLTIGWLDDLGLLEDDVHRAVNVYRDSFGLSALISDVKIADKAREHSRMMAPIYATTGVLVHSNESVFTDTGFGCGENVLARPRSTSETLMYGVVIQRQDDIHDMNSDELAVMLLEQWIDSPGHEANMRGIQYTYSGVGIYYDFEQETMFATQNLCFMR